jgi:hypothetical protein
LPATTGYLGKNNLICFFKLKKKLKWNNH